ncbi:MAG: M12 family metallo-peptidase [Chitinophagaceae bacterium]|jgi:hypothetical protein|nr:M12 family metallo-peptidase [Chitinophagaceae bacterium]
MQSNLLALHNRMTGRTLPKYVLTLILVCISMSSVWAQRSINLNDEKKNLSLKQFSPSTDLQKFREAKSYRAFAVNPALQSKKSVNVGDIVSLQLFEGKTYTASVANAVSEVSGNFTLTLKLPAYPMAYAIITTSREGKSLVTMSIPELGESFGSRYASDASYLIEIDPSKIERPIPKGSDVVPAPVLQGKKIKISDIEKKADTVSIQHGNTEQNGAQMVNDPVSCGPAAFSNPDALETVDVLIVYTPAAAAASYTTDHGGISNVISSMIALANLCMSNSQTGITFNVAHSEQVDYVETSPANMGTTLTRLSDPLDGYMDNVQTLRSQYNADLVQLITTEDIPAGIAYEPPSQAGDYSTAFSVVNVTQVGDDYPTSAHEMGHNFGLGHGAQQIGDYASGIFPYSLGWTWAGTTSIYYLGYGPTTKKASVMSYWNGYDYADNINAYNVPYYSNPSVSFEGQPTGDATQADAARSLREMKHVIAYYSDRLPNLPGTPANIVVSNPIGNGATFSWDADQNATTYWVCVSAGIGYTYFTTSNTAYPIYSPDVFQPCTPYEIWITALNACGDAVNSQHLTFTTQCNTDPTVNTQAATNIANTTATLNKTVTANGNAVTDQGFEYKEMSAANWETSADGNLTGLTKNTQYKYYAYATTSAGTFNGIVSTFTTTNILTVTGLHLTAQVQGNNNVLLKWSTATETNTKNFTVQRSTDNGNTWSNINTQPTQTLNGNSSALLNYTFTDANTQSGVYAYRIMETDINGNTQIGNIVEVEVTSSEVKIYPNPVNSVINVTLPASANNVRYRLFGTDGKTVKEGTINNQGQIPVSGIVSGIYLLQIAIDNMQQTYKVQIQH